MFYFFVYICKQLQVLVLLRLSDITSKFSTDPICSCTYRDNMFYIQFIGVLIVTCSAYFKTLTTVLVFVILFFLLCFFPFIIPPYLEAG